MPTPAQLAWLKTMVPAAQTAARLWHVPASITLAQCILESAWGESQLARRANNYFGIKAVDGQDYCQFTTREVVTGRSTMELAAFARYGTVLDSFAAHAHLLASTPRYAPVMALSKHPEYIPEKLMECGYSTEPHYADFLLALMRQLDLYQYDVVPSPETPAAKEAA